MGRDGMGSVGGLESESFGTGGQTWKPAPALVFGPPAAQRSLMVVVVVVGEGC